MIDRYAGDPVSLELITSTANVAKSLTIKDANDVPYTLKSNERLVIDTLTGTIDPSNTTVVADVFADIDGDGAVSADELTVRFSYVVSQFNGGPSGLPFPVGITPKAITVTASSGTTATAALRVTGMARVVKGQTEGLRPSWRESLAP